jgi:peroxiredoxin (alkyl hydroperoxide reductase subunit C)
MPEQKEGCVKAARGPIKPASASAASTAGAAPSQQEVSTMLARVGKEAPDFEANAYVESAGFKPVKLSDYKGRWIVLCFYPGDFTFV